MTSFWTTHHLDSYIFNRKVELKLKRIILWTLTSKSSIQRLAGRLPLQQQQLILLQPQGYFYVVIYRTILSWRHFYVMLWFPQHLCSNVIKENCIFLSKDFAAGSKQSNVVDKNYFLGNFKWLLHLNSKK